MGETPGAEALPPVETLTADEARRLALRAQGFVGAPDRRGGVPAMLRSLGAVQLDTISVLARSHELVAYSRLGAIGRDAVESAYWDARRPARTFEFWAHAACVLPIEEWPWFAFRRRHYRARGWRWGSRPDVPEAVCPKILSRLRDEGPLTATDLGGARREAGAEWWGWSEVKIAVEWLLDIGEVVCVERRGWRRVYDLPERAIPAPLLRTDPVRSDPSDDECLARLVRLAGRSLGVATVADLADYYRLGRRQVEAAVAASGLLPVEVAGWNGSGNGSVSPAGHALAWADPDALAAASRGRHRTTLLSPFDSLIWERKRTKRLFGWTNMLEAYKPAAQREHGYFVMPLLSGGRLLGRVDPKREGQTLVAKQVGLEGPRAVDPMASALVAAAGWVGCDSVVVGRVSPGRLAQPLRSGIGAVA